MSIENQKIELLRTVKEYINNLRKGITKSAEYFQSGEDEKGFNMVTSIAEGINWIADAIESTRDIVNKNIFLDNLNDKLNQIVEAMENRDTVLIGDLFQYELLPIIDEMDKVVSRRLLN
ncbi:hypothetical protein KM803_04385 [Clostridium tyrobutyricum]|uniref:hypothetical protein n=1 Tax=Clostridium tyrobutyricum TaxID=1519 RepID=UPI001C3814A0|nr:hypothetical protein [Clostridium tyrobutyricum]MBV4430571.1 hypothetical protein [Clostridium tyrobutyricum]